MSKVRCAPILLLVASLARADAPPALRCEPAVLTRDSTSLVLTLPDPHGRELAVSAPDGRFLYLAWGDEAGIEGETPRIAAFASARELTLDPRTLEGFRFSASSPGWERVFGAPGEYELRTGDVLQGDATPDGAVPVTRCRVRWTE